jgi:hypothetical protein
MNLEDYIKSIDAFLLNEEFAEGTSEDMQMKVKELEALKAEFLKFLEEINAKGIELKNIQAKAKEGGGEPVSGDNEVVSPKTSGEKTETDMTSDGEQPVTQQGGIPTVTAKEVNTAGQPASSPEGAGTEETKDKTPPEQEKSE